MTGFGAALAFAALPALGNLVGALLAEVMRLSARSVSYALHAATGVVLAVVGLEIMPTALEADAAWVPIGAFVAGGAFFLLADAGLHLIDARFGRSDEGRGPWMIYFGVAVDLFSDGVMIGAGTTIATGLGLVLAMGQVPADLPEGFAVGATLRRSGIARRRRLLVAAALVVPVVVGTTIGYLLLREAPELVRLSVLAFTGGVLATVVVEEIVPEAHAEGGARFAAMATVGGFALFAAVSRYLSP
ncbi:MAG: ZIP family zinc transporter [Actinobacteria bacterium]|nr:ZIP family zinc transporter [Actinomycetota bacterium]